MSDGDDTPFEYEPTADLDDGERGVIREEGATGRTPFDASPYMRQLRGRGGNQEYLDVKWRLLWLRREHPDAEILTEHVRIDEGMAIFKATVTVPTGGKATGYGSETAGDFGDFIEKAETKAIGRALNALGYGAQFSEKGEEESIPAPAATPRSQPRPVTPDRPSPARSDAAPRPATPPVQPPQSPSPARTEAPPRPSAAPARGESIAAQSSDVADRINQLSPDAHAPRPRTVSPISDEPVPIRPTDPPYVDRPTRPEPQSESRPSQASAPGPARSVRPAAAAAPANTPDDGDDVDLADMTWTAFWAWARPLGYNKRGDIEQFLGHSIDALTPAEVRTQVRTARGEG